MKPGITIAVAGKGGVGKTTFAALMVHALRDSGCTPILAVDADPNSNLGELLGLEAELTVGALRERTFTGPQAERERPAGWDARAWVEYRMQQAVVEGRGFDLLVMGRPEGPGCYCYANSLLREHLQTLAAGYRYLVVDNEAGLEHLSRRLCRRADFLFVVDDDTPRARQAGARIVELAGEVDLRPGLTVRVVNHSRPAVGPSAECVAGTSLAAGPPHGGAAAGGLSGGMPVIGREAPPAVDGPVFVPYDPILAEWDALGRPLVELREGSAAVRAVGAIVDDIVLEGEDSAKREP